MTTPVFLPEAAFSPLANLRDLGGIPVAGGTVAPGLLWRGDDVSLSPAAQVDELAVRGLRTVIDLRSAAELETSTSPFLADAGIAHEHLAVIPDVSDPQALGASMAAIDSPAKVGAWYAHTFATRAEVFVRALGIIADTDGGVLFHCAAGKDRTGMLAAAVLSVLGARESDIVVDYALTDANVPAVMERIAASLAATGRRSDHPEIDPAHPLLRAEATAMESMLAVLGDSGGPLEVLRAAGLDPKLEQRLREKLVAGA
ncbi:tyrosine-protein phosphatase [Paeniglutamicibacter sp. R2-26]|uniref:tyrosine-protein phosphatase n=1 Tax=Paeniglutamicibacter sp. R2-26 TaxID=3144417 RepID=UPI003EE4DBA4